MLLSRRTAHESQPPSNEASGILGIAALGYFPMRILLLTVEHILIDEL